MKDILDKPGVGRAAAASVTLSAAALLYVLSMLLVNAALYLMGAVAVYYLWTTHIRTEIAVRRFRKGFAGDRKRTTRPNWRYWLGD